MSVFVLVHGAFHGRWCFRRLVGALETRGHRAVAIDLPGHGDDETDPARVTMNDYVAAVSDTLDAIEHEEPILVGHSMGGLVVSAVAEARPNRIAGVGYIAAYVPKSGESLMAIEGRNPAPRVIAAVTPAPDMSTASINAEMAAPFFYNDCSEADRRHGASKLCVQPGAPMLTPVVHTEEAFGRVPKGYFVCEDDLTIPVGLQEDMLSHRDDVEVIARLASGHSPFLSKVDELADGLDAFAARLTGKSGKEAA